MWNCQAKGRTDYTLRKPHPDSHPVAVALIESKPEDKPPAHGLEQAKLYAASKRLSAQFFFATNGHQLVESAQSYRLIDPTNYRKTVDKMPSLLQVLGGEVDLVVRDRRSA